MPFFCDSDLFVKLRKIAAPEVRYVASRKRAGHAASRNGLAASSSKSFICLIADFDSVVGWELVWLRELSSDDLVC